MMEIRVEPDSEESEHWISLTGDGSAETESPTWKLEMYVAVQAEKE
jgi:hypothetical protein